MTDTGKQVGDSRQAGAKGKKRWGGEENRAATCQPKHTGVDREAMCKGDGVVPQETDGCKNKRQERRCDQRQQYSGVHGMEGGKHVGGVKGRVQAAANKD